MKNYIDENAYLNVTEPEMAYLLGFIWADGYIKKYSMGINFIKSDYDEIKNVFDKTGIWSCAIRNRQGRKESVDVRMSKKVFCDFLKSKGYDNKSYISPSLYYTLNANMRRYFIKGIIDGDGCFYISKNLKTRQFSITSTYEQNWQYMIDLCNELNIKYNIKLTINKKSKYSQFRILKLYDIKKIGDYIYHDNIHIGLNRKYLKFKKICSLITDNFIPKKEKVNLSEFEIMYNEGKSLKELSLIFKINIRNCYRIKNKINSNG